jgi:uncharacterized protein
VPALRARVTDQAQLLPPDREAALEAKLAQYERETGHQIAVLTVETTEGEPIEMYALRVAESWKLGRAGVDDGALLLVASQDRTARIEVGYGLEGSLNDAIAKRVIEEAMIPRFREGDFAGGLDAATDWMMRAARGDALPEPQRPRGGGGGAPNVDPIAMLIFLAFLSSVISAPFRKRMRPIGALLAGGVAGAIVWFLLHVAAWSALAFVLGALFGWMGPSAGMGRGRRGGSWGGYGGGFGGGSWGGGGGGFGGGGGGFGGGGASGRW